MSGSEPTGFLPRVIVLSHEAMLGGRVESLTRQCLYPQTPFEAAAEILAEPTDALVVDLDSLPPGHLGLLTVARRTGTTMILTGKLRVDMDAETLSGARLVARYELADAIASLSPDARRPDAKVTLTPARPVDRPVPDTPAEPVSASGPALSLDHPVLTPDELSALLEDGS